MKMKKRIKKAATHEFHYMTQNEKSEPRNHDQSMTVKRTDSEGVERKTIHSFVEKKKQKKKKNSEQIKTIKITNQNKQKINN